MATKKLREREPVAFNATLMDAVKTLVLAIVALMVGFKWVDWSEEQTGLVVGVIAAAFVVLTSVFTTVTRAQVTPMTNPRDPDGKPLEAVR